MTTTNYQVSRRLEQFLAKTAPEPDVPLVIFNDGTTVRFNPKRKEKRPAPWTYSLMDILGKQFCEAVADKMGTTLPHRIVDEEPRDWGWDVVYDYLSKANKFGGFLNVQSELLRLMEEK